MRLDAVLQWLNQATGPALCTIDGQAGVGKSTLAQVLAAESGWTLISMDDVYPGWSGLDAAIGTMRDEFVPALLSGVRADWHQWDWAAAQLAERVSVPAGSRVIVEGCGATALCSAASGSVLQLWLSVPEEIRQQRIHTRDGAAFDAQWPEWERNWNAYLAREQPQLRAVAFLG